MRIDADLAKEEAERVEAEGEADCGFALLCNLSGLTNAAVARGGYVSADAGQQSSSEDEEPGQAVTLPPPEVSRRLRRLSDRG